MENKLNEIAIAEYVEQFSKVALDSMFRDKEYLSGSDILTTPVKQIGLLTLSEIFESWKSESKKLESPYFDYSGDQIKELMAKLMNTLSNNIKVGRTDLEPLFKQATLNSLMLMFSPYKYYRDMIETMGIEEDSKAVLKEKKKFIRVNSELLTALIDKAERDGGISVGSVDELFSRGDILPEDIDKLMANCSEVLPLTADILYEEIESVEPQATETPVEEVVEQVQQPEISEQLNGSPESDIETEDHLVDNTFFVPGEISTVNEQFTAETQESLADTLAKENKGTLKSMLTINQKFMFINDLFDGNQEDFLKVIEFLDDCSTEADAITFVQNNYIKRSLWREEAPAVKEFYRLLSLRFN